MCSNLKIEKYDHFGRGISKIDGKVVFIKNSLIGDIVNIKVIKENTKYLTAINLNYKNNTLCPYYLKCGGCNILHMSYKDQLKFKENKVKEIISKNIDNVKINDILYSEQYGYRNKVILHVNGKNIGYYKDKSNDIIDIENCIISDDKINDYILKLRDFISIYPFNGDVKIRTGINTLISIDGNVNLNIKDYIDSDVLIVNGKCLTEKDYIISEIFDMKFKISDKSFFQVNKYNVNLLYEEVINFYKNNNNDTVLDLYSGTGTIGILVSKYVKKVIGIEIVKDAVKDANFNKDLNNINNIEFICGKVEDNIDKFKNIDSIIVDPPRSGLDIKTIKNILEIKPKSICYVSCDINTLSRDLKLLSEYYDIMSITPVDMFVNTYHVECVCILNSR